jgi:hypothetical protein
MGGESRKAIQSFRCAALGPAAARNPLMRKGRAWMGHPDVPLRDVERLLRAAEQAAEVPHSCAEKSA